MKSAEGIEVKIGDKVYIPAFEGLDKFFKPISKKLEPTFAIFYTDFQNCVEYCKKLNAKQ